MLDGFAWTVALQLLSQEFAPVAREGIAIGVLSVAHEVALSLSTHFQGNPTNKTRGKTKKNRKKHPKIIKDDKTKSTMKPLSFSFYLFDPKKGSPSMACSGSSNLTPSSSANSYRTGCGAGVGSSQLGRRISMWLAGSKLPHPR